MKSLDAVVWLCVPLALAACGAEREARRHRPSRAAQASSRRRREAAAAPAAAALRRPRPPRRSRSEPSAGC